MKGIDQFFTHIRPHAPGVSSPAMYNAVRQAAMRFCERTRLWKFSDTFASIGDAVEILVPPAEALIFEIDSVFMGSNKLTPIDLLWLDANYMDWRTAAISSQSRYFTQTDPDTIMMVPPSVGNVRVNMILKPSEEAVNLPTWMVDSYRKVIAEGALAELLMIPNQSFSQPDMAAAYAGMFDRKLDALASSGRRGQHKAPMRTVPQFF